jgi:hypothetical protein
MISQAETADALEDICMRSKPNIRLERFKNAQAW